MKLWYMHNDRGVAQIQEPVHRFSSPRIKKVKGDKNMIMFLYEAHCVSSRANMNAFPFSKTFVKPFLMEILNLSVFKSMFASFPFLHSCIWWHITTFCGALVNTCCPTGEYQTKFNLVLDQQHSSTCAVSFSSHIITHLSRGCE